ncbi:MAG: HEAT repeat domain-containing protein [Planctomycetes bacterium]|nr:HEAT repeat domain-containing protein [Planctomycetota bacterium]
MVTRPAIFATLVGLGATAIGLGGLREAAAQDDVKTLERDLASNNFDVVRPAADRLLGLGSLEATQALARGLALDMPYSTFTRDYIHEKWQAKPADDSLAWILNQGLADKVARVRRTFVELLARWKATEAVKYLLVLLGRDADAGVRAEAAWSLAALGAAEAVEPLARKLGTSDWWEKVSCLEALAVLSWEKARPLVEKALSDRVPYVHNCALLLLRDKDPAACLPKAIEATKDPAWQVKAAAMATLADLKEKESVQPLIDALGRESARLKHDAWMALRRLSGMAIPDNAEMWQGWWNTNKDTFDPQAVAAPGGDGGADGGGGGGDGNTQITYHGIVVYSNRVCFSLDCSGSMADDVGGGRTKLKLAQDELTKTLRQFGTGRYFNVIFFPTAIQPWKPRLQAASPQTLSEAIRFIESRTATTRGNMYDAFVAVMDDPTVDTIFTLSDGRPSAGEVQFADRFMALFLRRNRYQRLEVHTILVGQGRMDREFMEKLAGETGGQHAHPQ